MTLNVSVSGSGVVSWSVPLGFPEAKQHSGYTRGRSFSGSKNVPGALGSLGCILPGQVLSPSPPRKSAAARKPGKGCRYSPGRSLHRDIGTRPSLCKCDCPTILGCEHSCGGSCSSAGGAVSSSSPGTATPTLRHASADNRVSGFCCEAPPPPAPEEEKPPLPRGRRGRREGGKSSRCSERSTCGDQGSLAVHKGPGDDVDRLIARCMTHERPAVLMQAGSALLDACIARLGEEVPPTEKRSDRIRRMLRLTDELRRYNADLTEQGVPTKLDMSTA